MKYKKAQTKCGQPHAEWRWSWAWPITTAHTFAFSFLLIKKQNEEKL